MSKKSFNLGFMYIFFIVIAFLSCKNEPTTENSVLDNIQQESTVVSTTEASDENQPMTAIKELPDACSLISNEAIKKFFQVKSNVGHVDITSSLKPNTRTCNFYWDGENSKSNVIVELRNYSGESEATANTTIQNLVNVGMLVNGIDNPIPFNVFDAAGKNGAYSDAQARYFWAYNDQYSFMVVANVSGFDEKSKLALIKNLAKELNANFAKY